MSEADVIEHPPVAGSLDVDAVEPADPFPAEEDRPCWRCYDSAVERHGKTWRAHAPAHASEQPDRRTAAASLAARLTLDIIVG
jgi:hypothetical protein